jgi:translation initiation factor 2 subunit 1
MRVEGETIHLSVKRVHRNESESKMNEFKRERKAEKMLERAGAGLNKTLDQSYEDAGYTLQEEFGSLTKAFEIALKNPELLRKKGIPEQWIQQLADIAEKSRSDKTYRLAGELTISSYEPNGIEAIKKVLLEARQRSKSLEVRYIAAPKYLLTLSGKNFKRVEAAMQAAGDEIVRDIRKHHGEASFVLKK